MIRRHTPRRLAWTFVTVLVVSMATPASGEVTKAPGTASVSGAGVLDLDGARDRWQQPQWPQIGTSSAKGSIEFDSISMSDLVVTPDPAPIPTAVGASAIADPTSGDIPARALSAYKAAALATQKSRSSCGLDWALLAGIGKIESNHGRHGGASLGPDGVARPLIIGIALDGRPGVALIADTDRGVYDGDTVFDHAVGPMQFIPGTWARAGVDGDRDGRSDPHDIDDAALAAARYLCAGGGALGDVPGATAALLRYNHNAAYGVRVLALASAYRQGVTVAAMPASSAQPGPVTVARPPTSTPILASTPVHVPTPTAAAAPPATPTPTLSPTPSPVPSPSPTSTATPTATPTETSSP